MREIPPPSRSPYLFPWLRKMRSGDHSETSQETRLVGLFVGPQGKADGGKGQLQEFQKISKGGGDGGNSGLRVTGSWDGPPPFQGAE